MGTNIKIRPVKISDVGDLQRNIYSQNSFIQTEKNIKKSLAEMKRGVSTQLVAEVSGEVVGTMKVVFNQHVLRRHRGELFGVVVNPKHQRKGVARLLFNECKKICVGKDLSILETTVRGGTPAEDVYRKLGFIQYGKLPRGMLESWGEKKEFDEVFFYLNLNKD